MIGRFEKKTLALVFFDKLDDSYIDSQTVALTNYDERSNVAIVIDPSMPHDPIRFRVQRDKLDNNEGVVIRLLPLGDELLSLYGERLRDAKILVNYITTIKVVD